MVFRSVNNFNGTSIRLLYSPQSGILCLHLFNLSPFAGLHTNGNTLTPGSSTNTGTQTMVSFRKMEPAKQKLLSKSLFRRASEVNEGSSSMEKQGQSEQLSGVEEIDRMRVPVFLSRNRRKMKQLRKHLWQKPDPEGDYPCGDLVVENGLVMRQVPLLGKLQFDAHTHDYLTYKRRRVGPPSDERLVAADYAARLKWQHVRES